MSKAKSIVNDVFRAYRGVGGLYVEGAYLIAEKEITDLIESDAGFNETLEEVAEKEAFKELTDHLLNKSSDQYNETFSEMWSVMLILENNIRNIGKHAAGMIVSPIDITDHSPLTRVVATKGSEENFEFISQYDMSAIDSLGFVKMDFLSLETLDLIKKTIDLVKTRRGVDIDIGKIKTNDAFVYKFLNDQDAFEGLFQISNPGFAKMIKSMKPDKIGHLVDSLALK